MRKLFLSTNNSKSIVSDESGAVLVVMVVLCVILAVLFAAICDFGKVLYVREQAQTATDAAALAAASSGIEWYVGLNVNGKYVGGPKRYLIDYGGWRIYAPADGDAWYEIKNWWIDYNKTTAEATANMYYYYNRPLLATQDSGITKMVVYNDRNQGSYPSVVVYATTYVPSFFPGFMKAFPGKTEHYTLVTCAQGQTYYRDIDTGKWIKPPARATWQN